VRARRTISAAFVAGLLATAVPGPIHAHGGESPRSCAWEARLDPTALNALYPDEAANYWLLLLPAAPGATLTIHGLYAHARYVSFTSYDAGVRAVDGLNDQRIDPDPGSGNPFIAGAARDTIDDRRHYTVSVVFGQRPATAPDNVLFTTSADGSRSSQVFFLAYRVFRPDGGLDIAGGEGLPSVTYNAPGGASVTLPQCPLPVVPANGVNPAIADSGSASSTPLVQFPGTNPPTYHKFFNQPTSTAQGATDNGYTGTTLGGVVTPYTMQLPHGGVLDNLDNAYVFAQLSHGYGNIAVIHARLPTFPQTLGGEPVMGTGQLRYWSLCTNDGPSQRFYGCLADDQVIVDQAGFYTVVVSTAAGRPANATAQCGVSWLPWGPSGATLVIMRNMLPRPNFTKSIQAARFGHETEDMGAFYPATTYLSTAAFEAQGCPGGDSQVRRGVA
jgi:hypothetical protein